MWKFTGEGRPDFAIEPGPGQESVWDYPRPPSAELLSGDFEVRANGIRLAKSDRAWKIRETASPPTYYLPADTVAMGLLTGHRSRSFCEWKGGARYWALASRPDLPVAWAYPQPKRAFAMLADHLSFYPGRVECLIDGSPVRAQAGGFYGGWITDDIVGPFKGEADTGGW